VIPSASSVEIGDTFYVWVHLLTGETCDTWVCNLMEFNQTSVGIINATGVMEGDWYAFSGFGSTGTVYNQYGNLINPQYFTTSAVSSGNNNTCFRVNFTTLDCGLVYINLSDMDLQHSGTPRTYVTANTTVQVTPQDPAAFLATTYNHTQINLTFTAGNGDDKVVICGKSGSYPTGPTDNLIYNGTSSPQVHQGLLPCTAYYYRAWGWNETTKTFSDTYRQSYTSTQCYTNFTFYNPSPANASTTANCSYNIPISVQVNNSQGGTYEWWINTTLSGYEWHGTGRNANASTPTQTMTGCDHNTTYWWNITVFDGSGDWAYDSYHFTTGVGGGSDPTGSNINPANSLTSMPNT